MFEEDLAEAKNEGGFMNPVVLTKEFLGCLEKFERAGRAEAKRIKEAMLDAQIHGRIKLPPRPETRFGIPSIQKFEVSKGDRLVVQVVGQPPNKTFVFLYAGIHDDTEAWLEAHESYRWVARNSDSKVEFVQVTETMSQQQPTHSPAPSQPVAEPQSPRQEEVVQKIDGPLLGFLETEGWAGLALRNETKDFLKTVDQNFMFTHEEEVLERLPQLEPEKRANLLYDLLCSAAKGSFEELKQRLALHNDEAKIVEGEKLAVAIQQPVNSEDIITFDDANTLKEFVERGGTVAEWMYFLHPSQRDLVDRDFNGPARLRGVSGSGKTCVLLHRARKLARRYNQRVLIVTLTESMRKLLDASLDDLCGVERQLIATSTVSSTIRVIVAQALGQQRFVNRAEEQVMDGIIARSIQVIRAHSGFSSAQFRNLAPTELHRFIREEFAYVRSRLVKADYSRYLETESFQRRGRGLALARPAREAVLDGLFHFESELENLGVADTEAVTQFARTAVVMPAFAGEKYRAVLIDEVQDLSQLELETIANLKTPNGEPVRTAPNGIFLVGDGTQTIYRRGFRLAAAGIQITGRSYLLKKNYRNTQEVLRAAYALVVNYEFADSDEGEVARPLEPDYASRHGARPVLVKCRNTDEEAKYVVATISSLCAMSLTPGQICVIGCNQTVREAIQYLLGETDLPFISLRDDVRVDSENIKISTIESSKGHEFHTVFIAGLVDGVIPPRGTDDSEVSREASRLYVAMTRARDDLHLSYSPSAGMPASRFLMHVADHCLERSLVNGQLREL